MDTSTHQINSLSLHDALPIFDGRVPARTMERRRNALMRLQRKISRRKMKAMVGRELEVLVEGPSDESEYLLAGDRKSTRLNSSHRCISYAVFCLKKKKSKVFS